MTNVEKKLIASMQQALEISRGEREPSRSYSLPRAPAPDAPSAREGVQITLSADEVDALRFCVETAEHCVRNHAPTAYVSSMGNLARAYDALARAAVGEDLARNMSERERQEHIASPLFTNAAARVPVEGPRDE